MRNLLRSSTVSIPSLQLTLGLMTLGLMTLGLMTLGLTALVTASFVLATPAEAARKKFSCQRQAQSPSACDRFGWPSRRETSIASGEVDAR